MRVPVEWLKEYVPIRAAPEALAKTLTMAGLEVTRIESVDGQPVLDLEITPNRADCLSILGIAREVAALTVQQLKVPSAQGARGRAVQHHRAQSPGSGARLTIRIEDKQGCQRYIGRLIKEVKVAPSPAWMQRRLMACGARPINNVVDITNYVLLEYGQPLHAFDFDRLNGGTIRVRRAQANEPITTLDGIRRALPAETLVIADATQAVAVAGVMGGTGSEVSPQTTAVLLESALFDPVTVRRTARTLGVTSESSYRFERGVDPLGVEAASARASALIQELADGQEVAMAEVGAKPTKRTGILVETTRMSRWLGIPLSPAAVRTALARLSCHVAASDAGTTLHVGVPSFRRDLTQEVDLAEEIARLAGYDRVPSTVPSRPIVMPQSDATISYARMQSLRCLCASLGLSETVNWALVSEIDLQRFGLARVAAARLANPLSHEHAWIRPTLLVGLLHSVRRNLAQGAAGMRFFEAGSVVADGMEQRRVGMALSGFWSRDWHAKIPCDFFQLKGVIEAVVGRLCCGALQFAGADQPWAEPGQSAQIRLDGRLLGVTAQVSSAIAQAFEVEQPVWMAELSVDALLAAKRPAPLISAPPAFPPAKRDLSVLVDAQVAVESLERVIREAGQPLAARVELSDRYVGAQVPAGKYSVTFSIEYRDPARTLTAAEVDAVHQRISQALSSRCGAVLR